MTSRHQSVRSALSLALGSFLVAWLLYLSLPGIFDIWSLHTNDYLFQLRYRLFGPRPVHSSILHLDIDDSSIPKLPLSINDKKLYASLLQVLTEANTAAVGVDMLFPQCLDQADCDLLVKATRSAGNVYYPLVIQPDTPQAAATSGRQIPPRLLWQPQIRANATPITGHPVFANFADLNEAARGIAHITCLPDRDGMFRRFPLLIRLADGFIPSLAFRMVCDFLKISPEKIEVTFGKEIILRGARFPDGRVKDIIIPVDELGRIIVNFAGPWNDSFPHYSIADVLAAAEMPQTRDQLIDEFEGSLVLVSDSTTGGRDFGPVPLESMYPLSGLHATIASSILLQDFLRELNPASDVLLQLVLCSLLLLFALKYRGTGFTVAGLTMLVLFIAGTVLAFLYQNMLINIVRPVVAIILALTSINIYKYILQEKERAFIRARFENYLAPEVLNTILQSPDNLALCRRKKLTIMFSDIAGFTAWSATQEPEQIHRTLNRYFEEMAEIVFHYGGTIDKYIGDGLLAFFGDPIDTPDHAHRTVGAAIAMQQKTTELREEWAKVGGMPLAIRIGINTGEVVVGNMGSEKRLEYTVIGAEVNLAQRLESNAPINGILISQKVLEEIGETYPVTDAGWIKAKGFKDEVKVFTIVC
ncbi:MAG: adenylate/guanylate cyclase domain-containing protein [Proteobacteria bacterium]|nr:adenylate/guanylate cyclase domain-containing protein [Pseudomonadota bacterium]MBU1686197.1 adenylate/guanylate cyclase domain-containing protein [Pseudomonadota bacterium]